MSGEIGMESVPGKGSTFWFTARFEKQPHRVKALSVPHASLDGFRVLIVDDNATNRTILIHQTASWKMIPSEAEDGHRALELLRAATQSETYDIVLMDMDMPGIDGFDLARTIKADPSIAATAAIRLREGQSRHTPIIAMTAGAMEGEREKCMAAGMNDYVSKPVKSEALRAMLAQWLSDSA